MSTQCVRWSCIATAGIALSLLAGWLSGCRTDEPRTEDTRGPQVSQTEPADGEDSTKPLSPAVARSTSLQLWYGERPGYVPAEFAELVSEHPLRFAMYSDGRVLYRDDEFQYYEVQLTDDEAKALLDKVREWGLGEARVREFEGQDEVLDIGTVYIGIDAGVVNEVELIGGAAFMAMQDPQHADYTKLIRVQEYLHQYRNERAHPVDLASLPK